MATRSLSGDALKKMPQELALKEDALNEREKKLNLIERDLKKLSINIEKKQNDIEEREIQIPITIETEVKNQLKERLKSIEKKESGLNKALNITSSTEAFQKFYTHLDEMYLLYAAARGSEEGLFDTIKMIIEARDNFVQKDK